MQGTALDQVFPSNRWVDPSEFVLPWDAVMDQLMLIVLLSIIIERALSVLFESIFFVNWSAKRKQQGNGNYKTLVASFVSVILTLTIGIDILAAVTDMSAPSVLGCVITGLVVAGGSKGSLKLFRDVLDIKSTAYRNYKSVPDTAPPPAAPNPPQIG